MKFTPLPISGLWMIEPQVLEDDRGFFYESYNQRAFVDNGINVTFVQDNFSRSIKNVLRGLHLQIAPFSQDKLVRVVSGEVFDVAVDLRKDSPTYKKWEAVTLSAGNKKMLYISKGFAHGFCALSEEALFEYKVSNFWSKECERTILWNDPAFNIDWPVKNPILSEKDVSAPTLDVIESQLDF